MKYHSPEQVLFIHSRIIDQTGGAHGCRDLRLLQSAVSRPKATFGGRELDPDLFHKTAALMESIACNHPFIDGNKRSAIVSTGLFLEKNGYRLSATQKELERFTLSVAIRRLQVEELVAWFRTHTEKL